MSANVQGMCDSFKMEALKGSHALGTQSANATRTVTTVDVIKAALYVAPSSIDHTVTAYSVTGEVTNGSGAGYTAGGVSVTNSNAPALDGTTAHWTHSGSLVGTAFSSVANFDCVLLYYYSSKGNLAFSVHPFGPQGIPA